MVPMMKSEEKQPLNESSDRSSPLTNVILDPNKVEKSEKTKNLIFLHISNNVLRKVKHCETGAAMCALLDRLYISTYFPNCIYEIEVSHV